MFFLVGYFVILQSHYCVLTVCLLHIYFIFTAYLLCILPCIYSAFMHVFVYLQKNVLLIT